MNKKLAIIFPDEYMTDNPLLYYSRKLLEQKGYEIIRLNYLENNKKDNYLQYVSICVDHVQEQLRSVDFSSFNKLVFVSKGMGTVVGAIYAKKVNITPYYFMISPTENALQLIENEDVSVFCGTKDDVTGYELVKKYCREKIWNLYQFKDCDHSLETGDAEHDIEHLKIYVSEMENIVEDLEKSIYDYDILCRNQEIKSMTEYKDKVLLIVNTATGCGFTPQYQALENMYKQYKDQGFEILDFPCNQFSNQAPGSDAEIHSFCTSRYAITFEQFSKIHVNGDKQEDLFRHLKSRKGFKGFDMSKPDSQFLAHKLESEDPDYEYNSDIKWNFTKFLVNRKGQVIERFEPTTDMDLINEAIKQLL